MHMYIYLDIYKYIYIGMYEDTYSECDSNIPGTNGSFIAFQHHFAATGYRDPILRKYIICHSCENRTTITLTYP